MVTLDSANSMSIKDDPRFFKRHRFFREQYWKEFVCGWGAAFINITVTYPMYKMIFRQMLHGVSTPDAICQLRDEGIGFLYRGILPPLCQKTLSMSTMFGVYERVRRPLSERGVNDYLTKIAGAVVAGTAEAVLMPFERIQTLLCNAHYHDKFRNTYHGFKVVAGTYGLRELYRGLTAVLLRNGPANIGFFILREEAHKRMPSFDRNMNQNIYEFICGASIGTFLSIILYPMNVLKVSMQNKLGGEFENMFKATVNLYGSRGGKIRYLYRGVFANSFRAFVSWGIINTSYENLKKLLH